MEAQIANITEVKAYKVVDRPSNARILPGKWVYDVKAESDGYVAEFRARWVVCGSRSVRDMTLMIPTHPWQLIELLSLSLYDCERAIESGIV